MRAACWSSAWLVPSALWLALLLLPLSALGAGPEGRSPGSSFAPSAFTPNVQGPGNGWHVFASEPGRFRVLLPTEPQHERASHRTWVGSITENNYVVSLGTLKLQVDSYDLPWLATHLVSSKSILDQAVDGLLDDRGGQPVERHTTTVQGYPARVVRFRVGGAADRVDEAHLVLVGRRLYIASATAVPELAKRTFNPFFDSFRFQP